MGIRMIGDEGLVGIKSIMDLNIHALVEQMNVFNTPFQTSRMILKIENHALAFQPAHVNINVFSNITKLIK